MSHFYNSLRLKMQDSLQRGKINSMPLAPVKSANPLGLNREMERLEKLIAYRMDKLKAAVKAGEEMAVEEARQAEQVAESRKAEVAVLEAKLKEAEEAIEKKDLFRQKMEETLTAKIKNLEDDIKKKDQSLATRDNEINDYKAKVEANIKQIGELELTNTRTKEDLASQAKRADDLAESSQERITALGFQLNESEELARQKINIYALTIADSVDHAVVRMVVSDTARALALFEERGVLVVDCKVLMIESSNKPGSLARIASRLAQSKINIDYAYLATSPGGLFAVLSTAADSGSDVTYVLAVQLCRLLIVLALTPLLAHWLSARRG